MRTAIIALSGFAVIIMVAVAVFVGLYISNSNRGASMEESIVASYEVNRNVLSNTTARVMEMAQVNEMYRDDLSGIIEDTFTGRYGADGSQAVFQWINEQNIPLDPGLYRNLQASIEAGRNEFRNSQDRLIDHRRHYQRQLRFVVSGFFLRLAGYPMIDLDEYDIIILDEVNQRFESGTDQLLDIRR